MTQFSSGLASVGKLTASRPWISVWCGGMALSAVLSLQGNPSVNRVGDCGLTSLLAVAVAINVTKRRYDTLLRAAQVDKAQFESDSKAAYPGPRSIG